MLKWLWIAVLVVILDQATKLLASTNMQLYQSIELIPFFNFTLLNNTGAAFSFLSDASGWQRWFFTVIALVVGVVIFFWVKKLSVEQRTLAIALSLILGGAIGNVIDRAYLGYVVDFIDFYVGGWHFPAFNIADSAITVGAIVMLYDGFFGHSAKLEKQKADNKL